jgi:hypothetical protein
VQYLSKAHARQVYAQQCHNQTDERTATRHDAFAGPSAGQRWHETWARLLITARVIDKHQHTCTLSIFLFQHDRDPASEPRGGYSADEALPDTYDRDILMRRSTSRFLKTDDRLARYRDDAFQAVIGRRQLSKSCSFSEERMWPVV